MQSYNKQEEIKKISKKINSLISSNLVKIILQNADVVPNVSPEMYYLYPAQVKKYDYELDKEKIDTLNIAFTIISRTALRFLEKKHLTSVAETKINMSIMEGLDNIVRNCVIDLNQDNALAFFKNIDQELIDFEIRSKKLEGTLLEYKNVMGKWKKTKCDSRDLRGNMIKDSGQDIFKINIKDAWNALNPWSEKNKFYSKYSNYSNVYKQLRKQHKREDGVISLSDEEYKDSVEKVSSKTYGHFQSIFNNINQQGENDYNLIVDDDIYKSLQNFNEILIKHYDGKMKITDYVKVISFLKEISIPFCKQKLWVSSFNYGHFSDYSYDKWLCHWADHTNENRINGLEYNQQIFFSLHWNFIFLCLISHQELFFSIAIAKIEELDIDFKTCNSIEKDDEDYIKTHKMNIPFCEKKPTTPERQDEGAMIEASSCTSREKSKKSEQSLSSSQIEDVYEGVSSVRKRTSKIQSNKMRGGKINRKTLAKRRGGLDSVKNPSSKIVFWGITNDGNFVFVNENNIFVKFQIAFEYFDESKLSLILNESMSKKLSPSSEKINGCESHYQEYGREGDEEKKFNKNLKSFVEENNMKCIKWDESAENRNTYLSLIELFKIFENEKNFKEMIEIKNGTLKINNLMCFQTNACDRIVSVSEYENSFFISTNYQVFKDKNPEPFFDLRKFERIYRDGEILFFEKLSLNRTSSFYLLILKKNKPIVVTYNDRSWETLTNVDDGDENNNFGSFKANTNVENLQIIISSNHDSNCFIKIYQGVITESIMTEHSLLLDNNVSETDQITSIDFTINEKNICYFTCGDNRGNMYVALYDIEKEIIVTKAKIVIHSSGDVKVWFASDYEIICVLDSSGSISEWSVKFDVALRIFKIECIHNVKGFSMKNNKNEDIKIIFNPLYKNSRSISMISCDDGQINVWNILDKNVIVPSKVNLEKFCESDLESDKKYTYVPEKSSQGFVDDFNIKNFKKIISFNDDVNRVCSLSFLKNMDKDSIQDFYFLLQYFNSYMVSLLYHNFKKEGSHEPRQDILRSIEKHFKTSKNKRWIELINNYILSQIEIIETNLKNDPSLLKDFVIFLKSPDSNKILKRTLAFTEEKGWLPHLLIIGVIGKVASRFIGSKQTKRRSSAGGKKTRRTRHSK